MELWYGFIELLGVQSLSYTFMKNALLAVILLAPVLGLMGTMVVSRGMSFFSDSLSHSAFTGVAIGSLLGITESWGMVAFGVVFAVAMIWVKLKARVSADTVIGVFSSTAIALGLMILTATGGVGRVSSFLVGDLMAVSPADILGLVILLALTCLYWCLQSNSLFLISVSPSLAQSRGVRVAWVDTGFAVAVAVAVMMCIMWVGALLINALLVLPAAGARNISRSLRGFVWLSVGISLACSVAGLLISFPLGAAPGTVIILLSAGVFFVTALARRR